MSNKLHNVFMKIAFEFSSLSHCTSKKVAAIAVKDGRIISTGINGTAPGYFNCDDMFNEDEVHSNKEIREAHHVFSETYEVHAEMNCILYAAKNGISLNGASMYCTMSPCWNCLKHISVVGIKNLYFGSQYDRITQKEQLKIKKYCEALGINIQYIDIKNEEQ